MSRDEAMNECEECGDGLSALLLENKKLLHIVDKTAQLQCDLLCCGDDGKGELCASCQAQEYMKPIYAARAKARAALAEGDKA